VVKGKDGDGGSQWDGYAGRKGGEWEGDNVRGKGTLWEGKERIQCGIWEIERGYEGSEGNGARGTWKNGSGFTDETGRVWGCCLGW
jgi:hypothetical protein